MEKNIGSCTYRAYLTDEELQLPAIEELCGKYRDWLQLTKELSGGRKTRAANRRADEVYQEIMSFKLPRIQIRQPSPDCNASNEDATSVTRELRSRSAASSGACTPRHQSIRAHMKKPTSTSVLNAAINLQHPSISATKIRQILRADSAQKKVEEERERQTRLRLDRKAKEERAEAQKRQMLEERAIAAKTKREQRLLHAAEVRKAREKAKLTQKLNEEKQKKAQLQLPRTPTPEPQENKHASKKVQQQPDCPSQMNQAPQIEQEPKGKQPQQQQSQQQQSQQEQPQQQVQPQQSHDHQSQLSQVGKLDETFKKPSSDQNNIDISVHDETTDGQKSKGTQVATWAKAPYLREAIITQYSRPESEILKIAREIFLTVKLPVDLNKIFGPGKSVNTKYLCRTSSAVWSPPNRAMKRTSSMVLTPNESKR